MHNTFRTDTEALGCVNTRCSENAIFSNTGTTPSWSPYLGDEVQKAITLHQNNLFIYNTYVGDWTFDIEQQGNRATGQQAVTAPPGAATAEVNLYGMTGSVGNVVYIDDIYVGS